MSRRRRGPSVARWNNAYPIGTRVRYWSGLREGPGVESVTRSEAWDVCGSPVVLVEGRAGGIALTHIEVIRRPRDPVVQLCDWLIEPRGQSLTIEAGRELDPARAFGVVLSDPPSSDSCWSREVGVFGEDLHDVLVEAFARLESTPLRPILEDDRCGECAECLAAGRTAAAEAP